MQNMISRSYERLDISSDFEQGFVDYLAPRVSFGCHNCLSFLIHNKEPDRWMKVRHQAKTVFELDNHESYYEIYEQKILCITNKRTFSRALAELKFKSSRNAYLEKPNSTFATSVSALRHLIHYFRSCANFRRFKDVYSIETVVSRKHIEAMQHFVKSNYDFVIIIESDAVFLDKDILASLGPQEFLRREESIYLNPGQGFELSRLGVHKLTFKEETLKWQETF